MDPGSATIVSIFDCDGTLFSARFGRGLVRYVASRGDRPRVRGYYGALLPSYLLRKARLIPEENLNRRVVAELGRLMAGWDLQAGQAALDWVAREFLLPTKRDQVVSRLRGHQADEHRVVLLSGVFMPCLGRVAEDLGVTDFIGTALDVRDGRYTGDIVPPVITGRDKLSAVRDHFTAHEIPVDWGSSSAYADSIHDRWVLEAVGHPVAVFPDPELLELARRSGWEVIGTD